MDLLVRVPPNARNALGRGGRAALGVGELVWARRRRPNVAALAERDTPPDRAARRASRVALPDPFPRPTGGPMAIDQAQVGHLAAQLMQQLEDQYGEDATLEHVALIVAVAHDGDKLTVHTKVAPECPPWTQRGLLEYAARHVSP
jgi:hypothetical protein